MPDYRDTLVAIGHNVALIDMYPVLQQPKNPGGIQIAHKSFGISGAPHQAGPFAELVWDEFESETLYQAVLEQFGILNFLSRNVTVYISNGQYTFGRYNALALQPVAGDDLTWDNFFIRNVKMTLRNLVQL